MRHHALCRQVETAGAACDHREPRHAQGRGDDRDEPADPDLPSRAGAGIEEAHVEVGGADRGHAIEHGVKAGHHREDHADDHQATEAVGERFDDKEGVGLVGMQAVVQARLAPLGVSQASGPLALLEKAPRDDARDDHEEGGQYLQVARERATRLRVRDAFRAEHPLHDHLVDAPIPERADRLTDEQARPRVLCAVRRPQR
mmetsp:Transcript_32312/g.92037  ORF Transcript_32312/g.92037 Transcript_32312/m.92037 type:complete len:201 (-) Transcript_32312:764-1366(-)